MKKIVLKTKPDAKPDVRSAPPKPAGKTGRPAASQQKQTSRKPSPNSSSSDHRKVLLFVLAGLFLVLGIVMVAKASHRRPVVSRRYATSRAPVSRTPRPYEPYRPKELGGMTIAEWMKLNEQNNPDLKARQQRLRRFEMGQSEEEE